MMKFRPARSTELWLLIGLKANALKSRAHVPTLGVEKSEALGSILTVHKKKINVFISNSR